MNTLPPSSDDTPLSGPGVWTPAVTSRIRRYGWFIGGQLFAQGLIFLGGIVIVRTLNHQEYAHYIIAMSIFTTITQFTDLGIGAGVLSVGGSIFKDRRSLNELIQTALRLKALCALAVIPLFFLGGVFLLQKNAATLTDAVAVLTLVACMSWFYMRTLVLEYVPKLLGNIGRMLYTSLLFAASRLVLLISTCFLIRPSVFTALAAALFSMALQYGSIRRWVSATVNVPSGATRRMRDDLLTVVRGQAASTAFYCVQGQLATWLISVFGRAQSVAEFGALGRLALLFAVIESFIVSIVSPSFARLSSPELLRRRYLQTACLFLAFTATLVAASALFSRQLLWILGASYAHLGTEVWLVVLAASAQLVATLLWSLNASRGWVRSNWLVIPLTVLTQILLIWVLDISQVRGAILFGLLSSLPAIVTYAWIGGRELKAIVRR